MPGPRDYSTATRAALAALSRGRCYFPGCEVPIFRFIDGEPYIDYQIAHIRDAEPGNRYVASMSVDDRRAFANLILLCKPHHELVDKRHPDRYSIKDLEDWKASREGASADALAEVGPVTESSLEEILQQSIASAQEQVSTALRAHDAEIRNRVQRVRVDTSYGAVRDALDAVESEGLLSVIGVRAETWLTDFYLRIQRRPEDLRVHLDTGWEPSVFSVTWKPSDTFSDVVMRLADHARPTGWWPGSERWEFATAMNRIVDTLLCGLDVKDSGGWIRNAVQLIGSDWLLSDWEALGLSHSYQILFRRLDEMDWYSHLAGKGWTSRSEVAEMLDQASFLRKLAAGAEDGETTAVADGPEPSEP